MEKNEWNEMWSGKHEKDANKRHGHATPDGLLVEVAAGLPVGRAIDVGCGLGSNVIWLAENGWDAVGVDLSDVAIERARGRAEERGVAPEFAVGDGRSYEPTGAFDLVCYFYVHLPVEERLSMFARGAQALRPGGHLLFVGHDSSDTEWFAQHLREHAHRSHDHGHADHEHASHDHADHAHAHGGRAGAAAPDAAHDGSSNDEAARLAMLARLTTPEAIAGDLEGAGLVIVRAEVVAHAAHGDGEETATTVVLARRA